MPVSDVDVSKFEKNESKNDIEFKKKNQNKKKLGSSTSKNQISSSNRKRK